MLNHLVNMTVVVDGKEWMTNFTSGGGLDDETLAPSRAVIRPSISHSEVVSESVHLEVVLGGDK